MINENEKVSLVADTLNLALAVLYGPDAPQKVRVAYDMILARETARYNDAFKAGRTDAEADLERQLDELSKQRDVAQSKLDMHLAQMQHFEGTMFRRPRHLPEPHQAVVWTPGLPQQPQHGGYNVDADEMQRMQAIG